jgi:DNA-binding ferritin-like protein (Dps family)
MKRLTLVLILLLLSRPLFAERPTTQSGDLSTPKKALKFFDRVGTDTHVDRAKLFYHAKTEDEKKVAAAFAAVDLASSKLRKAAATRFDDAAGDAMIHAVHDVTADDIEAATEKIEGDKATLNGKNFRDPVTMVKVDGNWKLSIADAMKESQATADDLVTFCDDLVEAIQLTQQELTAEKFANASLLERAIKRRVRALTGGE